MKCSSHPNAKVLETGFRHFGENQRYKCSKCHKEVKKKFLGIFTFLVLTIFLINLSSALNVDFVSPTPANGSTINTRNFIINATIDTPNPLASIIYTWNNTNYTVINPSCIAGWDFENRSAWDTSNNNVRDVCGNSNITLYNSLNYTFSNGLFGNAINFSGRNAYGIVNITRQNFTNGFTLSVWTYTYEARQQAIFNGNIFLQYESNNNLRINLKQDNGTNILDQSPPSLVTQNSWQNFIFVYNNSLLKIYRNGINVYNYSGTGIFSTGTGHYFGGLSSTSRILNASVDKVRIWNYPLTESEITFYNNTLLDRLNNTQSLFVKNQSDVFGISLNQYSLFANDTSNNLNQSIRYVRIHNIINLSSNILKTQPINFYGYNIDNTFSGSSNTISDDMTCTKDSVSNYNLLRSVFDDSGATILRYDMRLDNIFNSSGSLTTPTELLNITRYAIANNYKIALIAEYTPTYNRNTTLNCTTTATTCSPINDTRWANDVVLVINNITNNGQYNSTIHSITIWNEAYNSASFLSDLGFDNDIRNSRYITLYNISYPILKTAYPNLLVSGSLTEGGSAVPIALNNFLGNFSNKMDFYSLHEYNGAGTINNITGLKDELDYVYTRCQIYNANCSELYLGEFNFNPLDFSQIRASSVSASYSYAINDNRFNITTSLYKLSSAYQNVSCDSDYRHIVFDQFNSSYYNPFNVTLQYSKYGTGSIYNTTIDTDEFIAVYSEKSSKKNIVITNKVNQKQNITLNCLSYTGPLMDISNGNLFSCATGSVNLGVLDEYDVKYYTEPVPVYISGNWYWGNYLGEPFILMSEDEIFNYVEAQKDPADRQLEMCSTLSGTVKSFANMVVLFILVGAIMVIFYVVKNSNNFDTTNFMPEVPDNYKLPTGLIISGVVFVAILVLLITTLVCSI